jgi:hypothetical protein
VTGAWTAVPFTALGQGDSECFMRGSWHEAQHTVLCGDVWKHVQWNAWVLISVGGRAQVHVRIVRDF